MRKPTIPRPDPGQMRGIARAALQTAVAAILTYVAMRFLGLDQYFIGVLSAVYILTPTIGGTVSSGLQRIVATFIGSAIGIACLVLLPDTWGTIAALGLSMAVLGGIAHLRPAWSYGMVAAVALSLRAEENAMDVAVDRGWAIVVGALLGMIATLVIWPERASARFARRLAAAQGAIGRRAAAALDRAKGEESRDAAEAADREYHENIDAAKTAAGVVRFDRDKRRGERLGATERLYHSLTLIDRAVEHGDDDPLSRDETFGDHVDAVRGHAVEVLDILRGEGEGDAQEAFDRLGRETDRAREILSDDDADDAGHLRRATLVFGMEELRAALGQLFDELRHDERRSVIGASLRAAGAERLAPD